MDHSVALAGFVNQCTQDWGYVSHLSGGGGGKEQHREGERDGIRRQETPGDQYSDFQPFLLRAHIN